MSCYRKFVALSKKHRLEEEKKPKLMPRRNLDRNHSSTCTTGIFKPVCLFCNQSRKRSGGKIIPLINASSKEIEESVKKFAKWKDDQEMLAKVSCIDFVAKEVKHHGPCRAKYQKEAELISGKNKKDKGFWHREQERYNKCFDALGNHINDTVISGKQVFLLSDLLRMYQSPIRDESEEFKDATPANAHLVEKITKHFGDKIKLEKVNSPRGTLLFSSEISVAGAIRKQSSTLAVKRIHLRNIALSLREDIMRAEYNPLPENITVERLTKGEISVPDSLTESFNILLPDLIQGFGKATQRKEESIHLHRTLSLVQHQERKGLGNTWNWT